MLERRGVAVGPATGVFMSAAAKLKGADNGRMNTAKPAMEQRGAWFYFSCIMQNL